MSSTRSAADQIIASLDGVNLEHIDNDSGDRLRVIESARRMLARLETPFEHMWQIATASMTVVTVCRIVMDVGLWEAWREAGGKEASLKDLCELCRIPCDIVLLRRLLRLCVAGHLVDEVGEDRYRSTPVSLALGDSRGPVVAVLNGTFLHNIASTTNLADFLAKHGYRAPSDPSNTPYMDLTTDRLGIFDRWAKDPAVQESFTGMMAGFADMRLDWTDIYDTKQLVEGFDLGREDSGTLLVDIGGAKGIDDMRLLAKHPQTAPGHIVLQDLPDVVATADVDYRVSCMGYDFFTRQPISGSRAYLLHGILHDWDDTKARQILSEMARAMKRGYSRLLVCDVALPPTGATLYQAVTDVSLMHLMAAAERTEEQLIRLLEEAGFETVRIWRHAHSPECVIEAELATTVH